MKSPKIPSPISSVNPTAPKVNASGLLNAQNERRKQRGVFSTLMGSNTPTGNRLKTYLDSNPETNVSYSQTNNPSTQTRAGMQVKK